MKHDTYIKILKAIAEQSTCASVQVGAIIVKDDHIISHGYNGTPAGAPHCFEIGVHKGWANENGIIDRTSHSAWSDYNEIHAEQNAIAYAARKGHAVEGASIYVTHSPCHQCAKQIVAAGITTVYVLEVYDRAAPDWDAWLRKHGVSVHILV